MPLPTHLTEIDKLVLSNYKKKVILNRYTPTSANYLRPSYSFTDTEVEELLAIIEKVTGHKI